MAVFTPEVLQGQFLGQQRVLLLGLGAVGIQAPCFTPILLPEPPHSALDLLVRAAFVAALCTSYRSTCGLYA